MSTYEEELYDDSKTTELDDSKTSAIKPMEGFKGYSSISSKTPVTLGEQVREVNQESNVTPTATSTKRLGVHIQEEDEAQSKAQLDIATGVAHVIDKDREEYASVKELYKKTLGVTEYDELRAKVHLEDGESFTDYYNRTHYVPEGFEMQAKLLLAEEKRKEMYARVEAGLMSEEDFLYETYGKDLLKEDGIDFSSPLYWYNRYQKGDYSDPRQNEGWMLKLIEEARELFHGELWYKDKAEKKIDEVLAGIQTGTELSGETVEKLFQDQFDQLTKAIDDRDLIITYYRGGMLKGFNPLIDKDGDGKFDYYYAPDGKLYNVNETGEGANTMRAYYNSDGSLNRIVASDSVAGEVLGEFGKKFARFFTSVVDLGVMILGAAHDVIDGGKFGDTLAKHTAHMNAFWNETIIGDVDYIADTGWKTNDGKANTGVIAREIGGLAGTITAFVATMFVGAAVKAASAASKAAVSGTTVGVQKGAAHTAGQFLAKVGNTKILQTVPGKAIKWTAKTLVNTAVSLTSWSNGAFGTGIGARFGTSLMLAGRDFLQSTAILAANQDLMVDKNGNKIELSDSDIVQNAFQGAAINFVASMAFRQIADQGAIKMYAGWANAAQQAKAKAAEHAGNIVMQNAPTLANKITMNTLGLKGRILLGMGNTIFDQVENIITAGTQTSLMQTGEVFNGEAWKSLLDNPQFMLNAFYQVGRSMGDELKYDSKRLLGASVDATEVENRVRQWGSELKQSATDEAQLKAANEVIVKFDTDIKTSMDTVNPVTGQKYTRFEAILKAAENLTVGLDLPETTSFIKNQSDKITKFIRKSKLDKIQATFNYAEGLYKIYNEALKDSFTGNKTKNFFRKMFSKSAKDLYNDFADYASKFVKVPIDRQLFYDTYCEGGYIDTILGKTETLPVLDKMNEYTVTTMIDKVEYKQGENGERILDMPTMVGKFDDEELSNYETKVIGQFGMTPLRPGDVVIQMKEKGDNNDSMRHDLQQCLNSTSELFATLNGIDPANNPLLIKLSERTYIIPNVNMGITAQNLQVVGSLLRCMVNLKFNRNMEGFDLADSIALVFRHFKGYPEDTPIDTILEDNINDIPGFIQSISGKDGANKVFNTVEAARILRLIKSKIDGKATLPSPDSESAKSFSAYQKAMATSTLLTDYEKARDGLAAIKQINSKKDTADQGTTAVKSQDIRKHMLEVQNFKEKYLSIDGHGNLILTEMLTDCIKARVFTQPELEGYASIPFQLDLKDQQLLNQYLANLSQVLRVDSAKSKELSDAFYRMIARKIGIDSEAVDLRDAASLEKMIGTFLSGQIKSKKNKFGLTKFEINNLEKEIRNKLIITPEETTTRSHIDTIKSVIDSMDYEDSIKTKLKTNLDTLESDLVIDLIGMYVPEDLVDAEFDKISNTKDFNTNPLGSAEKYLSNKYGVTLEQVKHVEDLFNKSVQDYNRVVEFCDENFLKGKNTLVLNLSEILGTEGEKVARKLSNDNIYTDYMKAETINEKDAIVFGDSTEAKIKYMEEQLALNHLYHSRANKESGDYVLVFDMSNEAEVARAKKILSDLYNFNGDIVYMAGKGNHPGIYFMSDAFVGITVDTDIKKLRALADLANAKQAELEKNLIRQETFSDPLALIESITSGYTFIDKATEIDTIKSIMVNTLESLDPDNLDENAISIINTISYWANQINVKLGKLAGNKVKEIFKGYSGLSLGTNTNTDLKQQLFVYKTIEALSEIYGQTKGVDNTTKFVPLELSMRLTEKELELINTLYTVELKEGSTNIYELTYKPGLTPDEFKKNAYKILKETKSLGLILPLGENDQLYRNSIIRRSGDGNPITTQQMAGHSPYTWLDLKLHSLFTSTEIDDMLLNIPESSYSKMNFTDTEYKDAIKLLSTCKTPEDILNIESDNFFIQMQKNAVSAALIVSEFYSSYLRETYSETADTMIAILGDPDARRNLALAIRQSSNKFEFDSEGNLELTDELLNSILKKYLNIQGIDSSKNSDYSIYDNDSDTSTLTGSQTSALKKKVSGYKLTEKDTAALKDILSLLGISRSELVKVEELGDNNLMKFYSLLVAASNNDSVQVSLQSLYSLSLEDFKNIRPDLENIFNKTALDKIEESLYLIHTGKSSKALKTLPARLKPSEKKGVSINASDGPITEKGENIKTHDIYTKARNKWLTRKNQDIFVKISDTKDIENNEIMKIIYNDIVGTKALVTKNLGSTTIQNLAISENKAALFYTIQDLANSLLSLDETDGTLSSTKSKLTTEQAIDLAWNLYIYTSGTQFESSFPEYIFYDKKKHKIINIAMSGDKYNNPYDHLVATIYKDYMDKEGNINLDNIVILSGDRNSFSSLYTESPSSFKYIDLDLEKDKIEYMLQDSIVDFVKSKGLYKHEDHEEPKPEAVAEEYSRYLFTVLNKTQKEYNSKGEKLASEIAIDDSFTSITSDPSDLSFLNSRNNSITELFSGVIRDLDQTTTIENREIRQSSLQKRKDFVSFGITDTVFNKYSDVNTLLNNKTKDIRRSVLNDLAIRTQQQVLDSILPKATMERLERLDFILRQFKSADKLRKPVDPEILAAKEFKPYKGNKQSKIDSYNNMLARHRDFVLDYENNVELYKAKYSKDIKDYNKLVEDFEFIKNNGPKIMKAMETIKESRKAIEATLDNIVTAFDSGNLEGVSLGINNIIAKTNLKREDVAEAVIKYFIATSPYLENKIFMTLDGDFDKLRNSVRTEGVTSFYPLYTDKKGKTVTDKSKRFTRDSLKKQAAFGTDIEGFFNKDSQSPFEVGIILRDKKGKVVGAETIYIGLDGIDCTVNSFEEVIRILDSDIRTAEYMQKYYHKDDGTTNGAKTSVKNWYEFQRKPRAEQDATFKRFNDLITEGQRLKAVFFGYNSEGYDVKHLFNLLVDGPYISSKDSLRQLLQNRFDLLQMLKEHPQGKGIDIRAKHLTLSAALERFGISLTEAHSALGDISGTLLLWDKVLDETIDTNRYQYNIIDTVNTLYKTITGHNVVDPRGNLLINLDGLKIDETNLSDKSKLMLSKLRSFREDPDRLQKIQGLLNFMNLKKNTNYSDIYNKSLNTYRYSNRSNDDIKFAKHFANRFVRNDTLDILSCAIDLDLNIGKITVENIDSKIVGIINKLLPTDSYYSLSDYAGALAKSKKDIMTLLGVSDEALTNWKDRKNGKITDGSKADYFDLRNHLGSADEDTMYKHKQDLFRRTANNSITKALEDVLDFTDKLPINNKLKMWIKEEAFRHFDLNKDKLVIDSDGKAIIPPAQYNRVANMLSTIDEKLMDYLFTDPIINITYDSIYREAQTIPLNRKIKTYDGKETYLRDDTIAMSIDSFERLFGQQGTALEISAVKSSLGLSDDQDIYIAVPRHPIDKTDSFHFFKVAILDNDYARDNGIDIAVNVDTMLTRLNGDLDGDHLTLLKPTIEMQTFANTSDKDTQSLQYYISHPLDLLSDLRESIVSDSNVKFDYNTDEVRYNRAIHGNKQLLSMLDRYKIELDKILSSKGDVLQRYEDLKLRFKEELIKRFHAEDHPKNTKFLGVPRDLFKDDLDKSIDNIVEDVFFCKPIEITSTVNTPKRFISYTDFLGLRTNKENIYNKALYRLSEVSTYGILSLNDSITGMQQKRNHTQETLYKDLRLAQNLIRISGSTKALINANEGIALQYIENIANAVKGYSKFKAELLKSDKPAADKVEALLRLVQIEDMAQAHKLAYKAGKTLQETDSDFSRMYNRFIGASAINDGEFKTFEQLFAIKNTVSGYFKSGRDIDVHKGILKSLKHNNMLDNSVEPSQLSKSNKYLDIYSEMPVLIEKTPSDALVEDTMRILPGLNNYEGNKVDIHKKVSSGTIKQLKELKGKVIKDKNLIKRLGYDNTNISQTYVLVDILDDNTVLINRHVSIKGQKIVFADDFASKSTLTTMGNVPESLQQYALLHSANVFDPSKMVGANSLDTKYEYVYYDEAGKEIPSATVGDAYNDPRVKYIGIKNMLVNLAECSALFNRNRKPTKFEELSNGNNIDSISGIFMYKGKNYVFNKDGTIDYDNKDFTTRLNEINKLNMPDRFEHNGMYNYLVLKLSTMISAISDTSLAKRLPNIYGGDKAELVDDIIRAYGFKGLNNFIEKTLRPLLPADISHLDKMSQALLSKELNDSMYALNNSPVAPNTNTRATSEGSQASTANANSIFYNQARADGELKDIDNGHYKEGIDGYVSSIDFINKLLELSGINKVLTREKLREAETYGQLNNGIVYGRTQTIPGTRDYAFDESEYLNGELNASSEKTGLQFETPRIKVSSGSIDPYKLTPEEDFDIYNFYNKTNRLLNSQGRSTALAEMGKTSNITRARTSYLLRLLMNDNANEVSLLQDTSPKYERVMYSTALPYDALDKDGNLQYKVHRTLKGTMSMVNAVEDAKNIGRSNIFFDYAREFQQEHGDKVYNRLPNLEAIEKDREDLIFNRLTELANNYDNLTEPDDNTKRLDAQINEYFKNFPTTIEDVKERAEEKFYSGTVNGEHKHFEVAKISLNQGYKIRDDADLQADRFMHNLNTEAGSKERIFAEELVRLNQVAIRNGSEEQLNKFAYVLAMHNKLSVIDSELAKAREGTSKYTALMEAKKNTQDSLTSIGISDSKAFIVDFEKVYTEEAKTLYVLLKSLNFEAEKYSKLCGEPGGNIFFLLTPSTQNNVQAKKAKAQYIISMLAKGNNPINYNTETQTYSYKEAPIYDGYNFFSSIASSISAIAKQSAIYENSVRMKQAGFMDSITVQNALYSVFNKAESLEKLEKRTYYKEDLLAINILLQSMKEDFADDSSMLSQLNMISAWLKTRDAITKVGTAYKEIFNVLNAYIQTNNMSLDEAINILNSRANSHLPEDLSLTTAKQMYKAYNTYSDVFAQICGYTDDALVNEIYDAIIFKVGNDFKLVDRFGRLQDSDSIYALSEASLEYLLDAADRFYGETAETSASRHKKSIVEKALRGELFIMDKTLAETLADRVFVKKDPGPIKSKLMKTSNWCVKWLMSNPLKIIDRLFKFTLFDTATLATANHKTLLKQPKAILDLRTYFSTKGAVCGDDLSEFLYTQGIKLNADNIGSIFNNNEMSQGFSPLKTYTDAVGNVFTYQTLTTRYAYWLATKEAIENGDYSVLGSAYYLKDKIKTLKGKETDVLDIGPDGTPIKSKKTVVTTAGEQAAFAMAQNLGAPGDFPELSRKLSNNGFVFTSFPLAAIRWGLGEVRSLGTALKDIFFGGDAGQGWTWLGRNGGGIVVSLIIEQFVISMIADMFGVDEETEEEWKETGALPNITQTLLTGTPVMDTFSSMNIGRELYGLTAEPFINKDNSEGSDVASGFERFFYKNFVSHINPVVKNTFEVIASKDLIDDRIIDTKDKYNMFENVARKMAGYIIGSAGANAFVQEYGKDKHASLIDNFSAGLTAAVQAEIGNSKAYKSNIKNYYKSLKNVNSYLYSGNSNSKLYETTADKSDLKSQIYSLISKEVKITNVYELLQSFLDKGYSAEDIRSAMRSCSLQQKVRYVEDIDHLRTSLSNADFANLRTALAFEAAMYPWLSEGIDYLTDYINDKNKAMVASTYTNKPKANRYNYLPETIYSNYNDRSYSTSLQNYKNSSSYYSSYKDPFDVYGDYLNQQEYNARQSTYKNNGGSN